MVFHEHQAFRLMEPQTFLELQKAQASDLPEVTVKRGGRHVRHVRQILNAERCLKIGESHGIARRIWYARVPNVLKSRSCAQGGLTR